MNSSFTEDEHVLQKLVHKSTSNLRIVFVIILRLGV